MSLLAYLLVGLLVGMIARSLVRGNRRLGCFGTSGLGILGSLVGGTILNAIRGNGLELSSSGFLGSVFGAVVVLIVAKKLTGKAPN